MAWSAFITSVPSTFITAVRPAQTAPRTPVLSQPLRAPGAHHRGAANVAKPRGTSTNDSHNGPPFSSAALGELRDGPSCRRS